MASGADVPTQGLIQVAVQLLRAGKLADAEGVCEQVLAADPVNLDALQIAGLVAFRTERPERAVELIGRALAQNPYAAHLLLNRGLALLALKRHEDALADLDRALAIDPRIAEAHHHRGIALKDLGRLDEAAQAYEAAVGLDPANALAHFNRGNVLRQLRRVDEAIASYRAAIALKPDFAIAHHNLAVCLLLAGRWAEGFAEYEWRKACPDFEPDTAFAEPAWTGAEDLSGKTLFIHHELFLGDMIQFCRYAPLAEQRGAKVVIGAPAHMHRLLRTLSPTVQLATKADPPPFDLHCALMSLPYAFRTEPQTVPAKTPYLHAEAERVAAWRARLGAGFRIGVCWQGSTLPYAVPMQRSFALAELAHIARLPGVRLVSLQKHDGLDQLQTLPAGMVVETLGDDFDAGPDAFVDSAAVIAGLDLVITADTAIAHLAGALGARTWIALPYVPDWRWGLEGGDTPWYPTVRLFRQPAQGDWASVFAAMQAALVSELDHA